MIKRSDVVVIGSGALGAATAFYRVDLRRQAAVRSIGDVDHALRPRGAVRGLAPQECRLAVPALLWGGMRAAQLAGVEQADVLRGATFKRRMSSRAPLAGLGPETNEGFPPMMVKGHRMSAFEKRSSAVE
jgi:hypothetical protein